MHFMQKIKAHQKGEYDFAKELMDLTLSDDLVYTTMVCTEVEKEYFNVVTEQFEPTIHYRWRPQYTVKKDLDEYHLARNFKVLIARFIRKPNSARKSHLFEGSQEEIGDFDVLNWIYRVLISVDYHCYKDDFHKIPKKVFRDIEDKYGWDYHHDFMAEIKEFMNILPYINREKKKLIDHIAPAILESLYEILPHVDTSRTTEEIKGFIAVSVRNRYPRKLNKSLGNRVMNRDGKTYRVSKREIKLRDARPDSILKGQMLRLTSKQASFYNKLRNHVQKELDDGNDKVFFLNESGEPIEINKRYFAGLMKMNESAFKKRLTRIRDKNM